MTDPNTPDGREPVRPPTVPEVPAGADYTGEPPTAPPGTPPPPRDVDATTIPGGPPPPAGPAGFDTDGYDNQPTEERPASGGDPSTLQPQSPPTAAIPGGPPPFDPSRPFAATPPPPPAEEAGATTRPGGLLVAGLIAVVVLLGGALAFLLTQGGDDDPEERSTPTTVSEDDGDDPEPTVVVEPTTTTSTTTTSTSTTTTSTLPPAAGNVEGEFVFLQPLLEPVAPGSEIDVIRGITDAPETFVSTTDAVVAICAGLLVDDPVEAEVVWSLDSDEIDRVPVQRYDAGEAGSCIGDGSPLAGGTYEVSLVDVDGGASVPANITLGASQRVQTFVNDTGASICRIDLVEATAATYELYELNPGISDGDVVDIDIADTSHAVRTLGCEDSDQPTDEVIFEPSDNPVNISTGSSSIPDISPTEVEALEGQIESYPTVLSPVDQAVAILDVGNRSFFGRIATVDPSVTLCTAWPTFGPLTDAEVVWEFNQVEIARLPMSAVDGVIGSCIEQGGTPFGTGSYQTYIATVDTTSDDVASFTAGRQEAQITFVNDTGVELCRVDFSPTLTNYYSFYDLVDENDNDTTFGPNTVFTLPAPVAEVDIRTVDCSGNIVSEVLDVPPTDQVVSVTTGQPV